MARQYNIELTRLSHRAEVRAIANVSSTATRFANALRELDKIMPGFLDFDALRRMPDGRMGPTTSEPLPLAPLRESTTDDFWTALAPELELPFPLRPEPILRPTLERAEAMARLFADNGKRFAGDFKETGRGKRNGDRDGRTLKQMLAEACYLIVAGRFGRAGAERAMSTPASRAVHNLKGPEGVPLFAGFVRAMHTYARKAPAPDSGFAGSVTDAALAMKAYVAERPELFGFIMPPRDAAEEATARKGAATFLRFLTDPAARPVVKSAS